MNNTVWLSIGENCMTSDLLRRFHFFAPSTIYSHSRCNIKHVLQIEEGGYVDVLNKKNLIKGKTYGDMDCIFSSLIKDDNLMFEFTHLNPLKILTRKLLQARIERMLKARNSEDKKIFCYHHRSPDGFSDSFKKELLIAVNNLGKMFHNSSFVFFTQKIVQNKAERGFLIDALENYAFVEIKSLTKWEGENNIYGRYDDDIFKTVFVKIEELLGVHEYSTTKW